MKLSVLCRCLVLLSALLPAVLLAAPEEKAPPGSIAAALQPFVDSHSLAGAVTLVADREKVLSLVAVGYADLAARKPMTTDALFWIASQSKPITATALMMLVDEGKVRLDDPVEKYLPEFKDRWVVVEKVKGKGPAAPKKPAHSPTVRNILSHTSGMPFRSAKETPTLDGLPLAEAVRSYADTPLDSEPGTRYAYSNAGINTAGRIIEVVSGMPYEDFLSKRLFEPLGMKDTTFWPNEEQLTRLAKSYRATKDRKEEQETTVDQLRYPLNNRKRGPMPAGGLFSTASDVGLFCRMMLNGGTFGGKRYLSEAAVKEMTTKQTGDLKESYGLGWSVGPGWFGHGGAFNTNMTVDTRRGLVRVWLVQQAGPYPGNGGEAQGAFVKAADALYGHAKK